MFITQNKEFQSSVRFRYFCLVETTVESSVSESMVSESVVSESVVAKSVVAESVVSGEDWSVVDERSGGGQNSGAAGEDGWVGLTLPPLSGLGGLHSGQVGSSGLDDLGGVLDGLGGDSGEDRGDQGLGVEGGGHQGLRVEGGGNSVIDWSHGQSGVSHTEAQTIGNIFHSLELAIGVNVRVSTGDSSVGVPDLLLDGVDVGVAVVQVSELILGVELAPSRVWSVGGIGSSGIGIASIAIASIGQGGGNSLGLLTGGRGQQS